MAGNTPARLQAGDRDPAPATATLRLEASHSFTVDGDVDRVFGLFDAVSERDWVDDWDPLPIYPPELSRAEGTVFALERDGRKAVWTVLRYAPEQHVAEYLVTEYDYQHRWIYVTCSGDADGRTQVTARYVTTALSPDGERDLARYGKDYLRSWEAPVQAAVDARAA